MLGALARGISESDKKFALLTQIRIKVTMPGYPQKSLKTQNYKRLSTDFRPAVHHADQ
jgi:hypothetical protein